jgi:hypothetical protein
LPQEKHSGEDEGRDEDNFAKSSEITYLFGGKREKYTNMQ